MIDVFKSPNLTIRGYVCRTDLDLSNRLDQLDDIWDYLVGKNFHVVQVGVEYESIKDTLHALQCNADHSITGHRYLNYVVGVLLQDSHILQLWTESIIFFEVTVKSTNIN